MASWLLDEFEDAAGTELSDHPPDAGGTWSKHPFPVDAGSADAAISDAGRLRATAAASVYYNDAEPTSADYAVEGSVACLAASGSSLSVAARLSPSEPLTGYHVRRGPEGWSLRKWAAGVVTILDSWADPAIDGAAESFRFVCSDEAKALSVNGVERLRSTDNAIAFAGHVGVRLSGAATDSTGFHLSRLEAEALDVRAREWDVWRAIVGAIEDTGAFSHVAIGEDPARWDDFGSGRYPVAIVVPTGGDGKRDAYDTTAVQSEYKLVLIAEGQRDDERYEALDRLKNAVENAINGASLAGVTYPHLSRIKSWRYNAAQHPAKRLDLYGSFVYTLANDAARVVE